MVNMVSFLYMYKLYNYIIYYTYIQIYIERVTRNTLYSLYSNSFTSLCSWFGRECAEVGVERSKSIKKNAEPDASDVFSSRL